jgi:hypothetical protein
MENSFWFWDASVDEHGTTMNALALQSDQPKTLRSYLTNQPDAAQWTLVSVMTHAVMMADRKVEYTGDI